MAISWKQISENSTNRNKVFAEGTFCCRFSWSISVTTRSKTHRERLCLRKKILSCLQFAHHISWKSVIYEFTKKLYASNFNKKLMIIIFRFPSKFRLVFWNIYSIYSRRAIVKYCFLRYCEFGRAVYIQWNSHVGS